MSKNKKIFVWYALLQCTYWTECAIASRYAAVYLQYKGMNNSQLGAVMAVSSLLSLLLSTRAANLIDRSKKFTVFHAVFFIVIVQLAAAAILPFVGSIAVLSVVYCLFVSFYLAENPLIIHICTVFTVSGESIRFSTARGMGSFGYAALAILIGILLRRTDAGVLPKLAFVILTLNLLCLCVLSRYGSGISHSTIRLREKSGSGSSIMGFVSQNRLFCVMIVGLVLIYAANTLVNHFSINIIRNVGGDESSLGYYSALTSMLELPMMFGFDRIMKRVRCSTAVKFAAVGFVIWLLSSAMASNITEYWLTAFTQAFSYAIMIPAMVRYVTLVIPYKDAAKGQAFASSAYAAGQIFADYLGGKMYDAFTVRTTLLIGTAACILGCVIIFSAMKKAERQS